MPRAKKIILIAVSLIVLFFIVIHAFTFIGTLWILNEMKKADSVETEWFTSRSPDGENNVKVILVGDAVLFGAQDIAVYMNDIYVLKTYISNDGKTLKDKNYNVIWEPNNRVVLEFNGEEMLDVQYLIDFGGTEITYEETIFTEPTSKFT